MPSVVNVCPLQVVLLERREASHPSADEENGDDAGDTDEDDQMGAGVSRRPRQGWEWSVACMQREHTHDVHALAIHEQMMEGSVADGGTGAARKGPVLVSGGLDASLSLYSVPGFKTQVGESWVCILVFLKHIAFSHRKARLPRNYGGGVAAL